MTREPVTEAALALYEDFGYHTPDCGITAEDNCTCDLSDRLAAIEAEAAAAAEARTTALEAALRDLTSGMGHGEDCDAGWDENGSMLEEEDDSRCSCGLSSARAALAPQEPGQ